MLSACLLSAAKLLVVNVGVDVCNEGVFEEALGHLVVVACARPRLLMNFLRLPEPD
jgi:hypothetical protein